MFPKSSLWHNPYINCFQMLKKTCILFHIYRWYFVVLLDNNVYLDPDRLHVCRHQCILLVLRRIFLADSWHHNCLPATQHFSFWKILVKVCVLWIPSWFHCASIRKKHGRILLISKCCIEELVVFRINLPVCWRFIPNKYPLLFWSPIWWKLKMF